jgi:methanogen homocitrate synthase
MGNYHKEGCWWASIYNDYPDITNKFALPVKVELHDATLRDGEQTPGVVFSPDDKLRIAEKLDEIGIERIEAGMPAVSADDYKAIKSICKRNFKAKVFAFSRAVRDDIDKAADCGVDGVVIEVPIGYPKLQYQFKWTWEDVLEKSIDCINYARQNKLYALYFPYDTTRAREEDLTALIKGLMKSAPPDAIGLVDTMGCALPESIQYLVRKLKSLTGGLPVEVHTHNDFGLGVATELAGAMAGADVLHCCINGLGERTGNAATEELVVALKVLLAAGNDYKLDKLVGACQLTEKLSGVALAANKPVAGQRTYTRESGIGVDLVVKNPLAMFAVNPQVFGREGDIVLGKKSGKASIEYWLNKKGLQVAEEAVGKILEEVKQKGVEKKGILNEDEFEAIVRNYL